MLSPIDSLPAGVLEDSKSFFLALPSGRRPSEEALRERTRAVQQEGTRLVASGSSGDQAAAVRICEELQALYVLLHHFGYPTVRFRVDFRALRNALRPILGGEAKRFYDVSKFAAHGHQRRVLDIAHELVGKMKSVPTVENRASLKPAERTQMLSAFTGVRYDGGEVFLEPGFASQMLRDWDKPLLSNTAHAVETLHMLSHLERAIRAAAVTDLPPKPLHFRVAHGVLAFVEQQYQSVGYFRDPRDPKQDLYATSSSIAIYKADKDIGCSDYCRTTDALRGLFPRDSGRYLKIRDWAAQRFQQLLESDTGTLIEFNHALRILRNLSGDLPEGVSALMAPHRAKLIDFLKRCIRMVPSDDGRQLHAFSTSPASKPACLTACLASARLAQYAKLDDAELMSHIERCAKYVAACQTPGSGFGSSIRHLPDILHTYMAVSFLFERERALIEQQVPSIIDFVRRCQKDGGYAIVPELKPTAYGTRLALQIFRRLDLPVPDRDQMTSFIKHLSFEVKGTGMSYVGFPARPMLLRSDLLPQQHASMSLTRAPE